MKTDRKGEEERDEQIGELESRLMSNTQGIELQDIGLQVRQGSRDFEEASRDVNDEVRENIAN